MVTEETCSSLDWSSNADGTMVPTSLIGSSACDCWGNAGFLFVPNNQSGDLKGFVKVVVRDTFREMFLPILKNGIESPSSENI